MERWVSAFLYLGEGRGFDPRLSLESNRFTIKLGLSWNSYYVLCIVN